MTHLPSLYAPSFAAPTYREFCIKLLRKNGLSFLKVRFFVIVAPFCDAAILFVKQKIDRNVENFGNLDKRIEVGLATAALPKAYGLIAHTEPLPQSALGQPLAYP